METPQLIPQPHGGALYRGGVKGNAGNRLRGRVRRQALHLVAQRLPQLAHVADGVVIEWTEDALGQRVPVLTSPTPGERTAAMRLLWDVAQSGQSVNMPEVKKRVKQQVEVIRSTLPPDQAETLLHALGEIWR
jgi:hypothetical protein